MKKKPLVLIGGGGHCVSCIDVIENQGDYEIIGILDLPDKKDKKVLNYKIIGSDEDIEFFAKKYGNFFICIGQTKNYSTRKNLFEKIKNFGGKLPTIISPKAYVSKYSNVGEGTIIMHNAIVNANAYIGNCCIINTKALIEHDANIGNFTHISTGAIINGHTKVGDKCFIGSNTVLYNNISITNETIISAGMRISKDILKSGIYK